MKKLAIATDLSLPLDAATQTFAFIARKGAGKTYAAGKLNELLIDAQVQVVILDTVGNWYGIRISADGKGVGLDIPVLGGLRGDIPLDPAKGALIADIVVETGRSMVLDLSQWSKSDRQRFATAFGERLWLKKKAERHPIPLHLTLEESQLIVPQDVRGDTATMVGVYEEIIRLGRNYGIGVSMITQRPQSVNKEVLNQTECLFVGQINGAQEREALKKWITHQGMDVHLVDELPALKVGTFYVWSPQWLGVLKKVQILPKRTMDASATPIVGDKRVRRDLKPLDLSDLEAKMSETIEKAKADDPKELRRQLSEANRRIRQLESPAKGVAAKPAIDQAAIDRAVSAERRRWQQRYGSLKKQLERIANLADSVHTSLRDQVGEIEANEIRDFNATQPVASAAARTSSTTTGDQRVAKTGGGIVRRAAPVPRQSSLAGDVSHISGTQQRMLDALALFESLGQESPSRAAVAGFCAISHTTGSFSNNLSALRTANLIADVGTTNLRLTDVGRSAAAMPETPPTLDELHRTWYSKLSGTQARMLEQVVNSYPLPVSRREIAEAIGVQSDTGSFSNNLSKLRTLGVIEDASKSEVIASDLLFPPGLQ